MSTLFAELEAFCQRLDRSDALLVRRAIDELGALEEISYHAAQLGTYIAQYSATEKQLASARHHAGKIAALAKIGGDA